jgi:hypothetical protein
VVELRECVALADILMQTNADLLKVFAPPPVVYHNAGVVFGVYSLLDKSYGLKMLQAFEQAMKLDPSSLGGDLLKVIQSRRNPFRNERI